MPSIYITNWINDIQNKIDFWFNNFPINPGLFNITNLPLPPIVNPNILNHNLTSCCPTPPQSQISFSHFPEPYYGNPKDDVLKLAVVLFFNPGAAGVNQLLGNIGLNTFHSNYLTCGSNYYNLSTRLMFLNVTINKFWKPKSMQIQNLLNCIIPDSINYEPLFMDLIPWHSTNFNGLVNNRFILPSTLAEAKQMIFLPAIFNAANSKVSEYVNTLNESKNKIVLFCVGSLYSRQNYLRQIGFKDITNTIPGIFPHTIIQNNVIHAFTNSKILKVWKISGGDLLENEEIKETNEIKEKEIIIINLWTKNVGMNIPKNICQTIKHILHNI